MKTKNLLFQLTDLESLLNDFSVEKLTPDEAFHLKSSFQNFKKNLLEIIFKSKENFIDADSNCQDNPVGQRTKTFEKAYPEIDIDTYDAIIEHYKSYGDVLKELKIETTMDKKDVLILNGTSEATKTEPEIDLSLILKECMGEMDLLQELITLFTSNALEFMGAAKIHLKSNDFEKLDLAAHKVKAGLAMMRTQSLHNIVVQIQKGCKLDKDPKHLEFLCNCFSDEFPKVKDALDRAYSELTNH
ncbi:Hpt domain-containing protein [Zobellia galactanivorans]|uniref:Hpt domain-containing protein n=1 Tax=Zobellia galactanivorans (strain DSM 12802 / CCUG 47099 / CIP 106680 / NCIMB 13871 / Dsij) TaxID=63186 RepID=UPI0026E2A94F|nr:Hpt domain-containing protein [Zobellia galactanivorans]MDO6808679.1 Hpt domain-containing protein [Zobellia galactanivorans]